MTFLFVEGFKSWLSNMADGIMGTLITAIRTLCFWLIEIIYRLMVNLYNLFDNLCNARLLDNEILGEMSRRIGFLLGIIMFFYVIFSFIQMLVNPDKITDKEKGAVSIVKKVIIVILMLALYNSFFDALYGLQKKVIDSNVISSIILPYTIAEGDKDKFGNLLSNSLIKAFYYVEEFEDEGYKITEPQQSDNRDACNSLTNAFYNQIYNSNTYDIGYMCLNESIEVEKIEKDGSATTKETYIINFDGIIAVAAGGFTVYLLAMYCFKIGIRMIQLAFLEIISPMAIISYLTPKKDNMLTKWWKIYSSTYVDVFIRIAIINFVVFLICSILSTNNPYGGFTFWESLGPNLSLSEKSFYSVVIILALLTFAKKAPDLIKELIPASASKLGFGMAMKDIVGLEKVGKWAPKAATGVLGGALGGAAIGLLGGGFGGFAGGLFKGGLSGLKGQGFTKAATSAWKSQQATNKRIQEWRNAGGTNTFGRWGAAFNQWRGAETPADILDLEKTKLEKENAAYKSFDSYLDAAEKRAEGQILKGSFNGNSNALEALKQKNMAEIYRQQSANIKREDYAIKDKKSGKIVGYNDTGYQNALDKLAKMASEAETKHLNALKAAKKDYITYNLAIANGKDQYTSTDINGNLITYNIASTEKTDAPTMQNLQQAAGVIDANKNNDYSGFMGVSSETLLGKDSNYESFDKVNSKSKGIQANNNNKLLENEQSGKAARANAKYSGRK